MNYGGIFDVSSKEKRLVDIKALLQDKSVWLNVNSIAILFNMIRMVLLNILTISIMTILTTGCYAIKKYVL